MALADCFKLIKNLSKKEKDFYLERSETLQREKKIDQKAADRIVLAEMRNEIDSDLRQLRSKIGLETISETNRNKAREEVKQNAIQETEKQYEEEIEKIEDQDLPVEKNETEVYEEIETKAKSGTEITGNLQSGAVGSAIEMKTSEGETLKIMKQHDNAGKLKYTSEDVTSGKELSLELVEPKPENVADVGAENIIEGKFKFADSETLYPSVLKVNMKGPKGEKIHIGNVQYKTYGEESSKSREEAIKASNDYIQNFKFSPEIDKLPDDASKKAKADQMLNDAMARTAGVKGVMPFGSEKEKNDFINIIRNVVKGMIDSLKSREWLKAKYGGVDSKHLRMAVVDKIKSFKHNNVDQFVKWTKENWEELIGKDFNKIRDFESTFAEEIKKEEQEAIAMNAQQKLESLRKPAREFFNKLEKMGIQDAEKKIIMFTKYPELSRALESEDTYREWLNNHRNADIKAIFEALDNNEGLEKQTGYQQAVYLNNFYSNTFLTEHLGWHFKSGPGKKKYVMHNINKSGTSVRDKKEAVIDHVGTYTYTDSKGKLHRNSGSAIQARYLDFKNERNEINNKYQNKYKAAQNDPKKMESLRKEKAKERHNMFLQLLSDLSGLPKKFWDIKFTKTDTEDAYNKDRVSATPAMINALEKVTKGTRYSDSKYNNISIDRKIVRALKFYFNESDVEGVQDNITVIMNKNPDPGSISTDFNGVSQKRTSSLEQNSHLLKSLYNLLDKKYDSDFYKDNSLLHHYFRKRGIIPSFRKINGTFNQTNNKSNESKDVTDSELIKILTLNYVRGEGDYSQSLGQFADKDHLYTVDVPKFKSPEKEYFKVRNNNKKLKDQTASKEEIEIAARKFEKETYGDLDASDLLLINNYPGGRSEYYKNMMYDFALNKMYLDQIIHGDIGQYLTFENLIKRSGTVNTPGYVPNSHIEGGIGWKLNEKGQEIKTETYNHVVANDMIKKILNKNDYEMSDGLELMSQEWADRLQRSMGDIMSMRSLFPKLETAKSSYSRIESNGRRALTKGNIVSVDVLAAWQPNSAYGKLAEYMKKHKIDRLSFESTTKLNEGETTKLFEGDKFVDADPIIKQRSIHDVIIQQELRHSTDPKTKKDSKQSQGNDLVFESSREIADLYNKVRNIVEKNLNEVFSKTDGEINNFIKKDIDKNLLNDLYFHLDNSGSRKNPVFQRLIQSVLASKITKEALERKIQRTSLISVPQLDVGLQPRRIKNGKIALEWVSSSQEGIREAKEFSFDPKNKDSKNQAELQALKYASQFDDMLEKDGSVKSWEFETIGNDIVVPGEFMRITRIPADGPRSHSLVRQYKRIPTKTNFIAVHAESQLRSGEDNDGDKRFVQTAFKNSEGNYIKNGKVEGLINESFFTTAEEYFKPKNNKFIERILNNKLFEHLIDKPKGKKSNDPYAFLEVRRNNQVGNAVISIMANMSTTFDYINKHDLKTKGRYLVGDKLILEKLIKDPDGDIKDAIGVILNLALDNVKDPQIGEMGINEVTAQMFVASMISSKNAEASPGKKNQMDNLINHVGDLIKIFNTPVMKEFVRLERERKKVNSTETIENTFTKLGNEFGEKESLKLKTLYDYSKDIKTIFDYINIGRETPRSFVDLRKAKNIRDRVYYNDLKHIDTKGFKNSPFLENVDASIRMAENHVLKNDILSKGFGKTMLSRFEKSKGGENDKSKFLKDDEFNKLHNSLLQMFSIKALTKKGDNLRKIETELKQQIEKDDPFTKFLQYNHNTKKIQILEDFKRQDIPPKLIEEAHATFDGYSPELKRKWQLYFHYKYGNSVTKMNGGFFDIMSRINRIEMDKNYDAEFEKWEKNNITTEEQNTISNITKFMNPKVDFAGEYSDVKGKRVIPDINYKEAIYEGLSKVSSEEEYNRYLGTLSGFEKKFAKDVRNTAISKGLKTPQYAKEEYVKLNPVENKKVESENKIEFNSKNPETNWLSNFFEKEFLSKTGTPIKSAEHYYQALKPKTIADRKAILEAKSPAEARKLGKKADLRDTWEEEKTKKMLQVSREKFKDPDLRQKLKATEGIELVHTTPEPFKADKFWGVDKNGEGLNKLGEILMAVREEVILEDTEGTRSDIIERLKKLKVNNDNRMYEATIAIPIIAWNQMINLSIKAIQFRIANEDIFKDIISEFKDENWYAGVVSEFRSNEEFLKTASEILAEHVIRRVDAIAGRNPFIRREEKQINKEVEKKTNGKIKLSQKEKIKVSELADILNETIVDKQLKKLGFAEDEIQNLTKAEQIEYAMKKIRRGDVNTYNERMHYDDPTKTEKVISHLSEEEYLKEQGIDQNAKTFIEDPMTGEKLDAVTIEEREKSQIPDFQILHRDMMNARTKSYFKYLNDVYNERNQMRRLDQLPKGTSLDDLIDSKNGKDLIYQIMNSIQGSDVLAVKSLKDYLDKTWRLEKFSEVVQKEYHPDFEGPRLATKAIGDIMKGDLKDIKSNIYTQAKMILMSRHHVDRKQGLLQFVVDQEMNAKRESNAIFTTAVKNMEDYRKILGLNKSFMISKAKGTKWGELANINNPEWLYKYDRESNKLQLLEAWEQDFDLLLKRNLSIKEMFDSKAYAKSIRDGYDYDPKSLSKKEKERVEASTKLLQEIRKVFETYHPTYKKYVEDKKTSFTIRWPEVFMSQEEATTRFGVGTDLYNLLKPSQYDNEVINLTTGQTYEQAKVEITSKYNKTMTKRDMVRALKMAYKDAAASHNEGGTYPGFRQSNKKIKTIQAAGMKDVNLPKEFRSQDFWHITSEASRSLIRAHHKRQFAPIAEYALGKYSGTKNVSRWLEREIDYEIYGLMSDSEYWSERGQRNMQRLITASAYTALPFNMTAATGNITAGYTQNMLQMPKETIVGLSMIRDDINRFRKAYKLMEVLEIATVVSDAELETMSRIAEKGGKLAFMSMELSERIIQVPVALGMIGDRIDNYDNKGRLKPGKKGISLYEAKNIQTTLMNIHGAYGDSRAHYSYYMIGKLVAQFRLPWMQSMLLNYYGKERTDYLGNYRIGAIPAMLKEVKMANYQLSGKAKRKRLFERSKFNIEKRSFYDPDIVDNLIYASEGEKLNRADVPKHLKKGWKVGVITMGMKVGLQQTLALLFDEMEDLKESDKPEDRSNLNKLQYAYDFFTMWHEDISIPFNWKFWDEQVSRPFPAMGFGTGVLKFGDNMVNAITGREGARYDNIDDFHAADELKVWNSFLRVLPIVGKPWLHFRKVARRARGAKYAEQIERKHQKMYLDMIWDDVMDKMEEESVVDNVVVKPFTEERALEIFKELYTKNKAYYDEEFMNYIQNWEEENEYKRSMWTDEAEIQDNEMDRQLEELKELTKETKKEKRRELIKNVDDLLEK